jgi:hypothetical protein
MQNKVTGILAPAGFEFAITESEDSRIHALDRAVTEIKKTEHLNAIHMNFCAWKANYMFLFFYDLQHAGRHGISKAYLHLMTLNMGSDCCDKQDCNGCCFQ